MTSLQYPVAARAATGHATTARAPAGNANPQVSAATSLATGGGPAAVRGYGDPSTFRRCAGTSDPGWKLRSALAYSMP